MNSKNTSLLTSAVIILLLVLSGPAQGFVLNMVLDNANPFQGDAITFTATIDIPQGESILVDEINLNIGGQQITECKFDVNGNKLAGCQGITITRLSSSNYGYGYGYGYGYNFGYGYGYNSGYGYGYTNGKLIYQITLDTSQYGIGAYNTQFKIKVDENEFTQIGPDFTISNRGGGGRCQTTWQCSSWSSCEDGIQTRSCTLVRESCRTSDEKPEESRTCISQIQNPITTQVPQNSFENLNLNNNQPQETTSQEETNSNTITGAVTGVVNSALNLGKAFLAITLIAFILLVLSTILLVRKIKTKPAKYNPKDFY